MVEQRYQAVLAVIADGRTVKEVAAQWGVSRQSLHSWLSRYEAGGLDGLSWRWLALDKDNDGDALRAAPSLSFSA